MSIDLHPSNRRFGRWTVIGKSFRRDRKSLFHCICDCGTERDVATNRVKSGASASCGCAQREKASSRFKTHGLSRTKEYRCWAHMVARCTDSSNKMYHYYGGRGISVHPQWMDFLTFLNDVGHAPTKSHTLDRIDNNGNYCPDNIRWVTMAVQSVNKRNNVLFDYNGQKLSIPEIARIVNMDDGTLFARVKKGLTIHQAIEKPMQMHVRTFKNKIAAL